MPKYIKHSICDFFLCVASITGICLNVSQCFYLPERLQMNAGATILCAAVLCGVLFACAYSSKTIALSSAAFSFLVLFSIFFIQRLGLLNISVEDTEANGAIFFLLVGFVSLLVFLLTRSRAGSVSLTVVGAVCICAVVFMEYAHSFLAFLFFACASISMFFFRNYRHNALHTNTKKVAFGRFALTSTAAAALVLALSVFVSAAVVQPLGLPTLELKLFTRYLAFEASEQNAVSSKVVLPDDDKKSSNPDDTTRTTRNPGDGDTDQVEYQDVAPTMQEKDTSTLNFSNMENFFYAIRYALRDKQPFFLILAPIVLASSSVFAKLGLRRKWYAKTMQKEKAQQVIDFYHYYLKKLELLSYRRQPSDTPIEFAEKTHEKIRLFAAGDADIISLTNVFVKAFYGGLDVCDTEHGLFVAFYQNFHQNCRKKIGTLRYCLKFFAF
jgi:hypothetical protein